MKILCLVLSAAGLWAQESRLSVSHPAWNGIAIQFLTRVEPPGDNAHGRLPGAVLVEQGKAHHLIDDVAHKRTFGYDLWVTPDATGNSVQLKIAPLLFANKNTYSVQPGWTLIELPQYPFIPKVNVGDTVAVDLLVNPSTGQKIVDYLTVTRQPRPLEEAAHDFTAGDAELMMRGPQVLANGAVIARSDDGTGMSGQVVWLYLPGRGRFSLSLVPNQKRGFSRNGIAAGDSFTFREGATEYRVRCRGPVAPGSGTYNLYVRHESAWYPGPEDTFLIGANGLDVDMTIRKP
jgi:hypothetical protein